MSQIMQIKQWLERQKIIKRWAEHKTQRTMEGCKIRKRPEWPYFYGSRPTQQIETHPSIIILLFNCVPDLILRLDKSCNHNWIYHLVMFFIPKSTKCEQNVESMQKLYRKIGAIFRRFEQGRTPTGANSQVTLVPLLMRTFPCNWIHAESLEYKISIIIAQELIQSS